MTRIKLFICSFIISLSFLFIADSVTKKEARTEYMPNAAQSEIPIKTSTSFTQIDPIVIPTPSPTQLPPSITTVNANQVIAYARSKVNDSDQWNCLTKLWGNESGWLPGNININSNAVGIPQSHPPTKLYPNFYSMAKVWKNGKYILAQPDYKKEIDWGLNYIRNRYKTPCGALAHYNARIPINGKDVGHWY